MSEVAAAAEPVSPAMARLSAYMSEAASRALPAEVIEKTKHHILDTFAAMVSGSDLPRAAPRSSLRANYGGEKIATVVCSKLSAARSRRRWSTAMLAHSDETDDSHAPSQSHPGCAVVPAALAAGEQFGNRRQRNSCAPWRSATISAPRVTMTMGGLDFQTRDPPQHAQHRRLFGAAAAAACAASLNAQQMRWLLDYTAQQSSGIAAWQRDTEHIEKAFVFAGMPARSGVTAALAGAIGLDRRRRHFLRRRQFFPGLRAQGQSRTAWSTSSASATRSTRTNIKKWTVGSPIQAPLDALENICRSAGPSSADQVQQVIVRVATSEANVVNNREMPDICLQHMVAVMLLDKTASFQAAHDKPRMQDPAVLRQRAKVQLVADEELERLLPAREAIVENHADRRHEAHRARRRRARHRRESDDARRSRRQGARPDRAGLGAAKAARLIPTVLAIETVKNVRQLGPLLQRAR